MFTHNRKSIDLNGPWKFCPDPMQRCRQQQWWRNLPSDESFFPCWDMEGLWDIKVPGTWKTQFEQLKWYDGHAVYVRDFELPELPPDWEAFLVFDGVVYACEVYLNGQKAAEHDWGYSPFNCRVTELVRRQNRLFVLVENLHSKDRVPGVRYDWNNDGGIINSVKVVLVPPVYIQNFRTQTQLDGRDVIITFEACLQSRARSACTDITFSIPELNMHATVNAAVGVPAAAQIRIQRSEIDLWSPENPKLYRTEITTPFETLTDEIGFRQVRTEDALILLNGEPIRLYGLCVHSEFKDTGRTATPQGIDQMIEKARQLGVNFLRCAHYPYAEIFGRALDRAGLMWWEEVPVYWLPNAHQDHMTRLATGMLRDTICRDRNRASLIIWSVSNECATRDPDNPKDNNYPYWFKAVPLVRQLDPTRLISSAEAGLRFTMAKAWSPQQADTFDTQIHNQQWRPAHPDEFYDLMDILAGNIYVQFVGDGLVAYHKFVEMMRGYKKPLIVSEFGSMSLRGATVPEDRIGSETRHCTILREAYQSFAQLPEIVWYAPWCLVDVRVPLHWRWYNKGKAVFRYGLLDENWQEKKAFNTVKEEIAKLKKVFGR